MQNKLLDWVQGILLHGTSEWTQQSCYRDIVACYLASFTRCMGKRLNSILLYKFVFVCGCVFLFHTHTHTHCRLMWIGSGMQKFCERTKIFLSHMVSFRFQWQNRQTHTHRHTKLHTHTPTHNHLHTYINICIVFEMRNNKCDCHCCCCSSSWAVSRCCLHFC